MSENIIPEGGLLSREELNGFEYVRTEFVTAVFNAKITLNYDNFTCNAACVRLFPESEYIQILANRTKQRLLIWACDKNDKHAVKWSIIKNNKPKTRNVRAKILCAKIYKMMNWDINNRYKILAVHQKLDELEFIVFNLIECEIYVPEDLVSDDGTIKRNRRRVFPIDWENTFGIPFIDFKSTYETDINSMHLLSNSTFDDILEKPVIVPRIPTAGEIITSGYYVPDEIVEKGKIK
jgi:hypothetical protein